MVSVFPSPARNKDLLFPKSSQTHRVSAAKSKEFGLLALGTPHSDLPPEQRTRTWSWRWTQTTRPRLWTQRIVLTITLPSTNDWHSEPRKLSQLIKRCLEGQRLLTDFISHYRFIKRPLILSFIIKKALLSVTQKPKAMKHKLLVSRLIPCWSEFTVPRPSLSY